MRTRTATTTAAVRVRKISYGRGVFAARDFRKGQRIAELTGRVIDDPDYASEYCVDLGGRFSLEPAAPFRYLNHCCTPNAELWVLDGDDEQPGRVVLAALRTIRAGEQLTIDYAWPWHSAIPCLCGSDDCRGWVVAADDLARCPR